MPLPGGNRRSQTDLFVLARSPEGGLVAIAVEGKAAEPFGDEHRREWRASRAPGDASAWPICSRFSAFDDERPRADPLPTAASHSLSVIEARRFGARHAVMLVHSFSPNDAWFADFLEFASLCGATRGEGRTSSESASSAR